ncbi:TetR/AcrR family transcriptional regulator [Nonomuraea sp. NPDC050394]|uniref:TetR/AcrR family transcriptional regulator n=1 Tax=Nonomuraea sp. NPDC050394 TaxID=3364363 RepID=UPI00378E89C7
MTRRNEASRQAILTAAFDLVGEIGYSKLSVEGIASRAGVGKQTIYRWWPSKGAVLLDALLMTMGGPLGDLPDTGDLEADLRTILFATVEEFRDPRLDGVMRALIGEIAHDAGLAAIYAERVDGPVRELKRRRLRAAQEAGQLDRDLDLDAALDLLWGPLLSRWLQRTGPLDHDFAARTITMALSGMSRKM